MTAGGPSNDVTIVGAQPGGPFAVSQLGLDSAQRLLKQRLLSKEPEMFVVVRMPDGTSHRLEALEGWRVMEVIRDWGLNIKAECGGACSCATCHVYVDEAWFGKLPGPSEDEEDLLYSTLDKKPTSRLSCQILLNDDLDGLQVTLAPSAAKDSGAD